VTKRSRSNSGAKSYSKNVLVLWTIKAVKGK